MSDPVAVRSRKNQSPVGKFQSTNPGCIQIHWARTDMSNWVTSDSACFRPPRDTSGLRSLCSDNSLFGWGKSTVFELD
jgi:hypothetical protein